MSEEEIIVLVALGCVGIYLIGYTAQKVAAAETQVIGSASGAISATVNNAAQAPALAAGSFGATLQAGFTNLENDVKSIFGGSTAAATSTTGSATTAGTSTP